MKKKILLVDDEKNVTDILYKFLSRQGFKVFTAADAEGCLKIARQEVPDLIVLDVMMPGIDGADLAHNLQEDEKTKNIPIIFLTGAVSEEEVAKKGGQIGNRLFISKFSDINEQINKIKKVLGIST
ncbi:MAG: response regulator [Candidatus Omnitrophica bacterium]|nr:response regulator [Candidatus Omnitrophota bacterium]